MKMNTFVGETTNTNSQANPKRRTQALPQEGTSTKSEQKTSNLKKTGKTSNVQAQHMRIKRSEYTIYSRLVDVFFFRLIIRYHTYQKHI